MPQLESGNIHDVTSRAKNIAKQLEKFVTAMEILLTVA
jgi:hypothetical protein